MRSEAQCLLDLHTAVHTGAGAPASRPKHSECTPPEQLAEQAAFPGVLTQLPWLCASCFHLTPGNYRLLPGPMNSSGTEESPTSNDTHPACGCSRSECGKGEVRAYTLLIYIHNPEERVQRSCDSQAKAPGPPDGLRACWDLGFGFLVSEWWLEAAQRFSLPVRGSRSLHGGGKRLGWSCLRLFLPRDCDAD